MLPRLSRICGTGVWGVRDNVPPLHGVVECCHACMGYPMSDFFSQFNLKGMRAWTCGAKTRSGASCRNYPMVNGRCRMHGGLSLKGEASPRYIHGKYAKKEGQTDE